MKESRGMGRGGKEKRKREVEKWRSGEGGEEERGCQCQYLKFLFLSDM